MINVFIFPDDINGYVWDIEDWLKMRIDHRIIGKLVGKSSQKQGTESGLPVQLFPEEISLLKEKSFARVVHGPLSRNELDEKFVTCDTEERKLFSDNLKKLHIERRKKELEEKIDFIIEGKKRKNPLMHDMNKEKIIEEELEKTRVLCEKNANFILTDEDILIDESKLVDAQWTYPNSNKEKLRYEVFKDLWERNFRLTCGVNFGGDFLCYEGDPIEFHASYIVACRPSDSKISCKELISYGRVGNSTRKIVVIASKNVLENENENSVMYQCLEWISDKDKALEKLTKK
ncbi:tRNA-splicing endonuclease subunit Sen34 [Planococcus citri]|uniref:tRNA-splicing endonuclease subunit Sen34 n=1 Tax=Planococcus citri TaxID=170843 RepID=UPI0031F7F793